MLVLVTPGFTLSADATVLHTDSADKDDLTFLLRRGCFGLNMRIKIKRDDSLPKFDHILEARSITDKLAIRTLLVRNKQFVEVRIS
jgi:hypothetical protein